MKRFLTALLLLLPLTSSAQQKDSFWHDLNAFLDMRADKAYAKTDTSYVGRYPHNWDARLFVKSTGLYVKSEGLGDFHFSSGMDNRIGVGLSYRGLGLSYSRSMGKKFALDLGLDSYGRHFCFDFSLRANNGLNGTLIMPDGRNFEADGENLLLVSNKLDLFYSFNGNFSYAAAMKQSKIQKRSAGSFIASVSCFTWDIVALEDDLSLSHFSSQFYKANLLYSRISIGAGYGYNLVFGQKHWLLHASVIPMWTFFETHIHRNGSDRTRYNHPIGKFTFCGTARAGISYHWGSRWSVGFSGSAYQMSSANRFRHKADDYRTFRAQDWQMRLSLGFRF